MNYIDSELIYNKPILNNYTIEIYKYRLKTMPLKEDIDLRDKIMINLGLIGFTTEYNYDGEDLETDGDSYCYNDIITIENVQELTKSYIVDVMESLNYLLDQLKTKYYHIPVYSLDMVSDKVYTIRITSNKESNDLTLNQALGIIDLAVRLTIVYKSLRKSNHWYGKRYHVAYEEVSVKEYELIFRLITKEINYVLNSHGIYIPDSLEDKSTFISRLVTKWKMFRNKK